MRFLALVSGGKDSIYNMQLAINDGNTPVCLLNMKMNEEKDSFMFQYAGNALLPGISECLGLPLHMVETKGVSKIREIEYSATEDDEIEELFQAVQALLQKYAFTAVSVGAISSVYQYNRVKNVCDRLHLEMLGYLWGMNQKELLNRMIKDGICAVVVKGGGYMSSLVGEPLSVVLTKYSEHIKDEIEKHKGLTESDFNICGEGGEYETITLNAPIFTKRIEIVKTNMLDDGHGVKSLEVLEYKVVDKNS